ncbi:cytochrome P450 [Winogradskya consettensis]|uniref:Cytochrome P-450 like protein n=2 Tax=Winogradskya consettensis TaxID=113560 RepID=A0A919T074_9ACTN|nr:cytochrome P-450 like protein [Actinoplanes consettensis]
MLSPTRHSFDLRDPRLQNDRYNYYREFRENDPIHYSSHGYWVLTRYDDCDTFLRAPGVTANFTHEEDWVRARGGPNSPVVRSNRRWSFSRDGAEHRQIRRLLSRGLSPSAIDRMRPRIVQMVNDMIDAMGEGEADLISGLALPLPVAVVGELLGIPPEDAVRCRQWTNTIADVVDPVVTPQMRVRMNRAATEFEAYVMEQLAERRKNPRDDMLSMLAEPDANGEQMSDEDIVAQVLVMYNAGHETSVNVIGNGMLALLRNPEQMELVRREPERLDSGFEELARYDTALQIQARRTTLDVPLGDKVIPAGQIVMVVMGAAHRDPAHYPDPDRFDLTRTTKSLAFGSGPHYCIAATLGRLEVVLTFREMMRRYSTIELASDDLEWYSHFRFLLGLRQLPLRLGYAKD